MNWTKTPPAAPGQYWWRRSWQWEPVIRDVAADGMLFSHRYEQRVPLANIGGEWGDLVTSEGT